MAHIWLYLDNENYKGWAVAPLHDHIGEFILSQENETPVKAKKQGESLHRPQIIRTEIDDHDAWILLAPPESDVKINGMRLQAGIKALHHRDEVMVSGMGRLYFSTEKLTNIEPFPGGERMLCGRCKQEIKENTPGVKCPGCDIWHHYSDDLPCWTYSPRCSNCDHPTEIDAGYRWTPEGL